MLAITQMGVHLVFFLHITPGPDNTNNVLTLAFGPPALPEALIVPKICTLPLLGSCPPAPPSAARKHGRRRQRVA